LSKNDVKFPPSPPSTDLCQKIVSGFSADTAPEVFEEAGCAVCGKLTQFVKWKNYQMLRILTCSKLMESQEKPDAKALIQLEN
jgi:hypothetical protein